MKRNKEEIAMLESDFQSRISRRSSSLVTISLDVETIDEIPNSATTTQVLQIGDDDEIVARIYDGSSSTERIVQLVAEVLQQDNTILAKDDHLGACGKLKSCLPSCKGESNDLGCCKQVLEFFRKKLGQLQAMLQSGCEKSYLETYFMYANICGVSPFRFDKDNKPVVFLKKIPYFILNTLAAVDTAAQIKYVVVDLTDAHKSTEIQLHLNNSLAAANVLLSVGFFISLRWYPGKYSKLLKTISASKYRKHLYTNKVLIVSVLICSSSFCLILMKTNIAFFVGYGIQEYLIENANDMQSLFCPRMWCSQIEPEGFNSSTAALGLIGWATKFAGNLCLQIARDGILFAALTLAKSANAFRFKRRVKNANPADGTTMGTEISNDYKWIKKISKHTNSAFNMVFRFFLLANIFMFAVFMDEWFDPHLGKVVKFVKLTNILFVCITFYFANQTAKTGDRFREWMTKEKNRTILGLTEINVQTENSLPSSIGLGRGAFYIHDSTLIGFASVVAAYYFGIVETRPK